MFKKIATATAMTLLTGLSWAQLDLNKATEIELDGLKGLGPKLTRQVMDERQKTPFKDWPDAMRRIQGIGPQKAANLSAQGVRVQGQPFEHPSSAP